MRKSEKRPSKQADPLSEREHNYYAFADEAEAKAELPWALRPDGEWCTHCEDFDLVADIKLLDPNATQPDPPAAPIYVSGFHVLVLTSANFLAGKRTPDQAGKLRDQIYYRLTSPT